MTSPIGHSEGYSLFRRLVVAGFLIPLGDGGCSDCGHQRSPELMGALVGAGAGGVLGFVAGLASPKYELGANALALASGPVAEG